MGLGVNQTKSEDLGFTSPESVGGNGSAFIRNMLDFRLLQRKQTTSQLHTALQTLLPWQTINQTIKHIANVAQPKQT